MIEGEGMAAGEWTFVPDVMNKVVRNFVKELFETLMRGSKPFFQYLHLAGWQLNSANVNNSKDNCTVEKLVDQHVACMEFTFGFFQKPGHGCRLKWTFLATVFWLRRRIDRFVFVHVSQGREEVIGWS